MNKHIFILAGILTILLFTILTGSLQFRLCGALFSSRCQNFELGRNVTGLVATAMALFVAGVIFAILFIAKKFKWAIYGELATLGIGAILLLAAVGLIMSSDNSRMYSPVMCTIAMTLSVELTIVVAIKLFTGKSL